MKPIEMFSKNMIKILMTILLIVTVDLILALKAIGVSESKSLNKNNENTSIETVKQQKTLADLELEKEQIGVAKLEIVKENLEINKLNQESLTTPITLVSSAVVAIIGLSQLGLALKQQHEKKKSDLLLSISNKFKEFEMRLETLNVKKMLDSEVRLIDLFPSSDKSVTRFVPIDDSRLVSALKARHSPDLETAYETLKQELKKGNSIHRAYEEAFIYAAIRDNFNKFLDCLEQLELMIQSSTVPSFSYLKTYLDPWVETIKRIEDENTKQAVLQYLGLSESMEPKSSIQRNVRNLFERYYRDVPNSSSKTSLNLLFCQTVSPIPNYSNNYCNRVTGTSNS